MTEKIDKTRSKKTKKYSIIFGILLLATALVTSFFTVYGLNSPLNKHYVQFNMNTKSATQFELDIAYAYVGQHTDNTSYTNSKGQIMSLISLYPSTVVFNASRIPGVQIANCESEIEVYGVHITTDKGMVENHAYFLGTNYNSSFPASRLIALEERINDLVNKRIYSEIKGDFYFNWTDNKSLLSISIGSVGEYSSSPSRNGIWDAGKPNTISVTANRIGYITINRNTTTVYVDAKPITVATTHLSNYEGGFLHNELVPPAKLSQIDLFHPKQIIQQVQPLK